MSTQESLISKQESLTARVDAERLAQLTMELIDTPSPMGGEQAVAQQLAGWFDDMGLETRLVDVEPDRPNVIGTLRGTGEGPTLLLLGHMDTTWAGDEEGIAGRGDAYLPKSFRDGDWIYGMGAYNMKSGVATAVHTMEVLAGAEQPFKGDIVIAGVCGETSHAQTSTYRGARYRGAGVGARFLVTNGVAADFALIAEPTGGRIVNVTGGYLLYELQFSGSPGATYKRGGKVAAGVPEAPDALRGAMDVLTDLRPWGDNYQQQHTLDGQAATNVSVISVEGGHPWRPSKVASYARAYVEITILPGQDQVATDLDFRRAFAGACERVNTVGTATLVQNVPGASIPADDYFIQELVRSHSEVYGEEPEITFDTFHADTSALTRFGIPAICYGPGGRMRGGGSAYYAPEGEMCFLPDLVMGARSFVAYAEDVANRDRAPIAGRFTQPPTHTFVR